MKSKVLKRILISALSVVAVLLLIFGGIRVYFRAPVSGYYSASEKAFVIPDINAGFVPQGLYYDQEKGNYLISGYSSKKDAPSSVYIGSGDSFKKINLAYQDGSKMARHSGGVALFKDWVYVAGSSANRVYVYSYSEMLSAKEGGSVKAIGEIPLYNPDDKDGDYIRSSALTVANGYLIVNEFYSAKDYQTLKNHEITTSTGEKHNALAVCLALSENEEFGTNGKIAKVYSICDKVQGMTVYNGKVYLSTSQGFNCSEIFEYNYTTAKNEGKIQLLGYHVPLYSLDKNNLLKTYKVPPMAEGIVFVDGKLVIVGEFACNKYILGKFTSAKWCYKTDLSKMKTAL